MDVCGCDGCTPHWRSCGVQERCVVRRPRIAIRPGGRPHLSEKYACAVGDPIWRRETFLRARTVSFRRAPFDSDHRLPLSEASDGSVAVRAVG